VVSVSGPFDKVTITKASGEGAWQLGAPSDRFLARNRPLRVVLAFAYDVQKASVVGGPDWLDKASYDIVAHTSSYVKSIDDMRPLVKALLADRFGLQAHPDVRQLAAFVLRVDQGGSKLSSAPASSPGLSGGPPPRFQVRTDSGQIVATSIDLKELTRLLSERMGRPVLDQTGLTGRYDFTLRGTNTPEAMPAELQQQLGLRLEAVTAPVDVIVVDHVHEPTVDVQAATASSVDVRAGALSSNAAARPGL
jgi:uncharacterized protein (TIGR03435 family)